jgi:hypothetical protein
MPEDRRQFGMSTPTHLKMAAIVALAAVAAAPGVIAHGNEGAPTKEITGEVVDLMCYLDHSATGEKHAKCAGTCIKNGGPVGLASNGKAYLIVGEHKTINDELAAYAGKTITLRGKLAERDGMSMLENAEIVKK